MHEGQAESSLVDNALDFILSAAEHARQGSRRSKKYALLHLVAGIELLMKERLHREHWSLLFADIDKARYDALASGDFKSVDFETACERLERISGLDLVRENRAHLTQLRALRNQIQHYALAIDDDRVNSLLAKGVGFFVDLSDELALERAGTLDAIHDHLRHFQDFVNDRLASVSSQLSSAHAVFECPRCWQDTLVVGSNGPHCCYCRLSVDPKELINWVGEGSAPGDCVKCRSQLLTIILHSEWEAEVLCLACGTPQPQCLCCGATVPKFGDYCPTCTEEFEHNPNS